MLFLSSRYHTFEIRERRRANVRAECTKNAIQSCERAMGLARAAWRATVDVFRQELECRDLIPGMVAGIQTFGELVHFHPHKRVAAEKQTDMRTADLWLFQCQSAGPLGQVLNSLLLFEAGRFWIERIPGIQDGQNCANHSVSRPKSVSPS